MIIECVNCQKKFSVNAELIPPAGRTIQCGSCNHIWFFDTKYQNKLDIDEPKVNKKTNILSENKFSKHKTFKNDKITKEPTVKKVKKKEFEIVEYKNKTGFTFSKFLSYIIVFLISFVGLLLIVDTFKIPLYEAFPILELLVFSLFETVKDIVLFIKDLF